MLSEGLKSVPAECREVKPEETEASVEDIMNVLRNIPGVSVSLCQKTGCETGKSQEARKISTRN